MISEMHSNKSKLFKHKIPTFGFGRNDRNTNGNPYDEYSYDDDDDDDGDKKKKKKSSKKKASIPKLDKITMKKMKPAQLKEALKARGLDIQGNAKTLLKRLVDHEESR
mmetsp:Transcript_20938/g.31453  ORF Transcript_20938/g.31453 Transcript_20938/m.31453 type:complete len:108 (-) Transcript_20938:118-441(-)